MTHLETLTDDLSGVDDRRELLAAVAAGAVREVDEHARTAGWRREPDIAGIHYRAYVAGEASTVVLGADLAGLAGMVAAALRYAQHLIGPDGAADIQAAVTAALAADRKVSR